MLEKPDRLTEAVPYPTGPCRRKGRQAQLHRKPPENIQASSLEELREHLEEEIDRDLQEIYELTEERLERTFWSLENEADELERRVERLARKLDEIKVPGEDEEEKGGSR